MLRALKLEPEKCTGCLQCEMACSYENEGVFNPAKSRIRVFTFHYEGRFAPYTCTQCDEAWCLHACPVDAIVMNAATGSKDVLNDVCVGCKVCTIACPFGTVNYNCGHRQGHQGAISAVATRPARRHARPEAITYVDIEQHGMDRMRAWAAQGVDPNRPQPDA